MSLRQPFFWCDGQAELRAWSRQFPLVVKAFPLVAFIHTSSTSPLQPSTFLCWPALFFSFSFLSTFWFLWKRRKIFLKLVRFNTTFACLPLTFTSPSKIWKRNLVLNVMMTKTKRKEKEGRKRREKWKRRSEIKKNKKKIEKGDK